LLPIDRLLPGQPLSWLLHELPRSHREADAQSTSYQLQMVFPLVAALQASRRSSTLDTLPRQPCFHSPKSVSVALIHLSGLHPCIGYLELADVAVMAQSLPH
jgi:hypothetical protein